jgi:hypothetical protein
MARSKEMTFAFLQSYYYKNFVTFYEDNIAEAKG